jgi:peroxiredoxin
MTYYKLLLHDFGNLNIQVITVSNDKNKLEAMADKMNFLFNLSRNRDFEAEIIEVTEDEQD